jgi:hypothetical protein
MVAVCGNNRPQLRTRVTRHVSHAANTVSSLPHVFGGRGKTLKLLIFPHPEEVVLVRGVSLESDGVDITENPVEETGKEQSGARL